MMKKQLILLGYLVFTSCLVRAQLEQLHCEKEGFAIVPSTNCSSYYYCVISANNKFYPIEYKCPSGEEFSLVLLKCMPEEENECGKLPEALVEDPILSEEFVCPSQGRFPDVASLDCKSYYTCTADLIPGANTCPSVTIFSWTAMKCVMPDTFTCPNSIVTTTEDPTTTNDPDKFVCTGEGRFADPQTVDCKTYYLCAKTPSGTVEASLNQCPSTTRFSPISSKCVTRENYVCPVTVSPTSTVEPLSTESATEPTTEAFTEIPTDSESTETVDQTTSELVTNDLELSTSTLLPTEPPTSSQPTSEISTEPSTNEVSTQETTTETEFVEHTTTAWVTDDVEQSTTSAAPTSTIEPATDPETETTDELTTEVSTKESTAGGTTDTVELTTADTTVETKETTVAETSSTDEVTHSVSVTYTEEPSTIQASTSEVTTEVITTPEHSIAETTISATTTEVQSTTVESVTNEMTTKDSSELFTCTGKGRFPNPLSSDCKSYYLCSENEHGNIEATLNQCPAVTVFDSVKLKCVVPTDYECSQGVSTTTDVTEEPITIEITTQEPPTTETFACPSGGRFPDPTSTDCKRYYLCSKTAAGIYDVILTQCPGTTLFSLENSRCVLSTQYQCPTNMPSTEPIGPSTTETTISTTMPDKFSCNRVGRQPDPSQTDCKKYKYCLLTATNEFLEYTFNCPAGTYFDPTSFICSISYICPSQQTTSTKAIAEPTLATPFVCTTNGRFSDPLSSSCAAYIMCLVTATGDVLQYNFECPSGYRFNPNEAKCVSDYVCV